MKKTTTLRSSTQVKKALILEMYRRGGVVEVGSSRKPGSGRDIYDRVADCFNVTPDERQLRVSDICPNIVDSRTRQNPANDGKRNAWDFTMLVACQKARYDKLMHYSRQTGVWELNDAGMEFARRSLMTTHP